MKYSVLRGYFDDLIGLRGCTVDLSEGGVGKSEPHKQKFLETQASFLNHLQSPLGFSLSLYFLLYQP